LLFRYTHGNANYTGLLLEIENRGTTKGGENFVEWARFLL